MIDIQYAYLVGNVILAVLFWLPIYIYCKDLRREMLLMSLLAAPLGPLTTIFFLNDYWTPAFIFGAWFPLEDFLFAFLIGGVGGVAYEAFFGKKTSRPLVKHKRMWALVIFPLGLLWMFAATSLGYTSIYASIALLLLLGLILIIYRPDLRHAAIFSAVMTGLMMFVMYQVLLLLYPNLIGEWWHIENLSLVFVYGVPLEEILWGASWGFFAGPVFEFVAGSRYIQRYAESDTDRAFL